WSRGGLGCWITARLGAGVDEGAAAGGAAGGAVPAVSAYSIDLTFFMSNVRLLLSSPARVISLAELLFTAPAKLVPSRKYTVARGALGSAGLVVEQEDANPATIRIALRGISCFISNSRIARNQLSGSANTRS